MAHKHYLIDGTDTKSMALEQYPEQAWSYLTGRPDRASGALVKEYFERVPWLYRAVNMRAATLASVPFALVDKVSGETVDDSGNWQNAVGYMPDPKRLLWLVESSLCMTAAAYLFKATNTSKIVKALSYHIPTSVSPAQDAKEGLVGFDRTYGGQRKRYGLEKYVFITMPDPYTEIGVPGSSPAKAALHAAGVLFNVDDFVTKFFARGAIKATILAIDTPDRVEAEKLKTWWGEVVGGVKNAWTAFVTRAKMVIPQVIGEGLESLQNNELTREKREDISNALGIPITLMFSDASTNATAIEDELKFLNSTIVPDCNLIQEAFNSQLFAKQKYMWQFYPEMLDAFQTDKEKKSKVYLNYIQANLRPSLAAQLAGLELPHGIEYQDLDTMTATAPAEPEPQGAPDDGEPDEALAVELKRWQRKALNALERGKNPDVPFESEVIPTLEQRRIRAALSGCKSAEEVRAAFAPSAPQDSTEAVLAALLETASALRETA